MNNPEIRIPRFDAYERTMHWMSALSFFYAALTGLAIWTPKLYWLSAIFGGGFVIRGTHPWAGVIFSCVMGWMFARWAKTMALDADDRVWLSRMEQYATHQHTQLPDSGRFNAGQKMLFWSQIVTALLLFLSGIVLWFPEWMPRTLRLVAILLHPVAAIASMAGIIVHIYMGVAAVPQSMRAMLRGYVVEDWARFHHPKWFRETRDANTLQKPRNL